MNYRALPKAPSLRLSTLGFGCMRLPRLAGAPPRIDEGAAARLLDEAIEAGVTYVDTGWTWHDGESEPFVGRALAGGRRDRVRLATKLPVRLVAREGDWQRFLDAQLERLATDHVDFWFLDAITPDRWEALRRLGGLRALERIRADGRARHVGFSFQGALRDFREVLDGYDWDVCQVPLNLLDARDPIAREGVAYARARNVGIVAVEPLRGGALASPPPVVREVLSASARPWSPAEWALRWVWHHAGVVTAVCGARSRAHLRENLAAAGAAPLEPADLERLEAVQQTYRLRRRVPCTSCGGCTVCALGIPVSDVFSLYNEAMFDSKMDAVAAYRLLRERAPGVDECTACGLCEPMCERRIEIPERLREAHRYLSIP